MTSSTTARPRAAHLGPERRRPLILDAAFAVFRERGYEGASMEAIAARAGVTKPVLYDAFGGKESLFTELLRREEERILGEIAAILPAAGSPQPLERTLSDGLVAFLRAVAASPDAYRVVFLGEGGGNAAIARRIQSGRAAQVDVVAARVLDTLRARGAEQPDPERSARLIAHAVVGVSEAAARAMLAEPGAWTPEAAGALLGRLIAHGESAL